MKTALTFLVLAFFLTCPITGQERASMDPPVIRSGPEFVSFSVRFSALSRGASYRVGLGAASAGLSKAQMELSVEGTPLDVELVDFKQGYTSSWWNVEEISALGYYLEGDKIPPEGSQIALKVSVSRAEADRVKSLYVFVAKKYGGTVWYLEDGAELTSQNW